jgi:hypothetical protein
MEMQDSHEDKEKREREAGERKCRTRQRCVCAWIEVRWVVAL